MRRTHKRPETCKEAIKEWRRFYVYMLGWHGTLMFPLSAHVKQIKWCRTRLDGFGVRGSLSRSFGRHGRRPGLEDVLLRR